MKFSLGEVVITPRACAALEACGQSPEDVLARHQSGDWGDVSEQARIVNEEGLTKPFNLVSTYTTSRGDTLTVVTKADRSFTYVHLDLRKEAHTIG